MDVLSCRLSLKWNKPIRNSLIYGKIQDRVFIQILRSVFLSLTCVSHKGAIVICMFSIFHRVLLILIFIQFKINFIFIVVCFSLQTSNNRLISYPLYINILFNNFN